MSSISYDVSDAIDAVFQPLLGTVASVATESNTSWFLTGAMARDLVLEYVHGIQAGRATRDVDLGVMVENWSRYEKLKERLCATGDFSQDSRRAHRLYYRPKTLELLQRPARRRHELRRLRRAVDLSTAP